MKTRSTEKVPRTGDNIHIPLKTDEGLPLALKAKPTAKMPRPGTQGATGKKEPKSRKRTQTEKHGRIGYGSLGKLPGERLKIISVSIQRTWPGKHPRFKEQAAFARILGRQLCQHFIPNPPKNPLDVTQKSRYY